MIMNTKAKPEAATPTRARTPMRSRMAIPRFCQGRAARLSVTAKGHNVRRSQQGCHGGLLDTI